MITLGINAAFHDSAAALVIDGAVVAASEEERFTRIKHGKRPLPFTAWELPFHAIDDCLRQAGLRLVDVDHVAYSYDPQRFLQRFLQGRAAGAAISLPLEPSATGAGPWRTPGTRCSRPTSSTHRASWPTARRTTCRRAWPVPGTTGPTVSTSSSTTCATRPAPSWPARSTPAP
jgi:hypothetical protein